MLKSNRPCSRVGAAYIYTTQLVSKRYLNKSKQIIRIRRPFVSGQSSNLHIFKSSYIYLFPCSFLLFFFSYEAPTPQGEGLPPPLPPSWPPAWDAISQPDVLGTFFYVNVRIDF